LLLLVALGAHASRAAAQQGLTGSYEVIGTTDLGADVRVNLRIALANTSEDKLFITGVALAGFAQHGQGNAEATSVILEPHGTSSFTYEFTLPQKEYDFWHKGRRTRLALKIQAAGGAEITQVISLVWRPL
jgi:hypothetical protein